MATLLVATSILCNLPLAASGPTALVNSFRGFLAAEIPQSIAANEVEETLRQELLGNVSRARIMELEEVLQPTFNALPKGEDGNLDHQGVRYALHRLFVQRHSWYIRGLEPSTSAGQNASFREWVPGYLQLLLEQRLDIKSGHASIGLTELAAIAAALEDLVRKEAAANLKQVFNLWSLPTTGRTNAEAVQATLITYLMSYLRGDSFKHLPDVHDPIEALNWFSQHYADWDAVELWMVDLAKNKSAGIPEADNEGLEFDAVSNIAGDAGEEFGDFNDIECRKLKQSLLEIEDKQMGRVRLSTFYQKGLYSHWMFNEKPDYLRAIGALDDSDKSAPRVILPNYMSSRSNCLEATSLYSVCCRNECEDLMGHLEREIASPVATTAQIAELVAKLPSDTIEAPRELAPSLLARLEEIAIVHGGKKASRVPLHGRLFAQWMHHAFPRECPYPHATGDAAPQTPDEWLKLTGEADATASMGMIHDTISNDVCAIEIGTDGVISPSPCGDEPQELLWTGTEEFYAMRQPSPTDDAGLFAGSLGKMFVCQLVLLILLGFALVEAWFRRGRNLSNQDIKNAAAAFCALIVFAGMLFMADCFGLLHRCAFAWAVSLGILVFAASKVPVTAIPARKGTELP